VVGERGADGQVGHHRDPGRPQHPGRPDTGEHQQMRRSDRPGAQHDPVGVQVGAPRGPGARHADGAAVADPDRHRPGAGQQRQVRPLQRRLQHRAAGPDAGAPVDVQRHRPHPGAHRRLRCRAVEIGDPRMPGPGRGRDEQRCTAVEFAYPLNGDRTVGAVHVGAEVQVGLQRLEVRQHIGPAPAGQVPGREVRGQTAAEVAAVDGA